MHHLEWLPLGGLKFGTPCYNPGLHQPSLPFSFVVAGVHPVKVLRDFVESDHERLSLQRSAVKFPSEVAGAAYDWWIDFLDKEQAWNDAMCATCLTIRTELTAIVVRQSKSKDPLLRKENSIKTARRAQLLEQLSTHSCAD